jgi:phosphonate transport system substrate-binding protein
MRRFLLPLAILPLILLVATADRPPAARAGGGGAPLKIGIARTFFADMTPPLIKAATEPFAELMQKNTDLTGEMVTDDPPAAIARGLDAKKLQLGVLHGFEFAWLHPEHPELKALMIAAHDKQEVRAYIVVRKDSPAKSFADLKGKRFAVPKRSPEHCRYFAASLCRRAGASDLKDYFGTVAQAANVETALDDVVRGKYDATVTDTAGLAFYQDLKPGVAARLRKLEQSEVFPPLVIAYRPGFLSDATLRSIREGLQTAGQTELGRDMMRMWKITAFEPAPPDFEQTLRRSLKAFPRIAAK